MFYNNLFRALLTVLLLLVVSACGSSKTSLIPALDEIVPLPDSFVLVIGIQGTAENTGFARRISNNQFGIAAKYNSEDFGAVYSAVSLPGTDGYWVLEVNLEDDFSNFLFSFEDGDIIAYSVTGSPEGGFSTLEEMQSFYFEKVSQDDFGVFNRYYVLDSTAGNFDKESLSDALAEISIDIVARETQKAAEEAEATERRAAEAAEAAERRAAEAAERQAQQVANSGKIYGSWLYRIEVDPITDAQKQFLYGLPEGYPDRSNSPFLRIGCYGASDEYPMGVTFFWGQSLQDLFPNEQRDFARVTARFDTQEAFEMGWAVSQSWTSTYPPNSVAGSLLQLGNSIVGLFAPNSPLASMNTSWTAKELHQALQGSQRAVFRGYPRSGLDLTLVFDTTGYFEASRNFKSHCNARN